MRSSTLLLGILSSSLAFGAGAAEVQPPAGPVGRSLTEDPATLDRALTTLLAKESPLRRFLDAANVRLLAFDSDKGGENQSLGLSYSFSKDIPRHYFTNAPGKHDGLALNLFAEGTIAADPDANPRNFLDSRVSFEVFRSRGGAIATSDQIRDQLNQLEDAAAENETFEELLQDRNFVEAMRILRQHMSTQYYVAVAGEGGLEANQTFSEKRYYYGGRFAIDVKAWNPASAWAKFDILDYPFAFTRRYIFNSDPEWMPRGSALPTLLAGIDMVEPSSGDPRAAVGDGSSFARWRLEVGYRTLVGHVDGYAAFFEATVRHYQEINPSGAVRSASLDRSTVFSAALLFPKGLFVSYSTGKLPFDQKDSSVYSAGWQYKF
jgi:hypothetical protein